MNLLLPDVSLTQAPPSASALRWVGMQGIDLPLRVPDPSGTGVTRLHARADVHVDLPAHDVKGIHMSRLYRLLSRLDDPTGLSPAGLRQLLGEMVASHQDCGSTRARLRLRFKWLANRAALASPGLSGWMSYPVSIDAALVDGELSLCTRVVVAYSSTCPCSASLASQWVATSFDEAFRNHGDVSRHDVVQWLRNHAMSATPHSQRSFATVSVPVGTDAGCIDFLGLIDGTEAALGTPVQTAVKRADEQAFAVLNGTHPMFVEDAARRLQQALASRFPGVNVHVRHEESLHPHDAVAWT